MQVDLSLNLTNIPLCTSGPTPDFFSPRLSLRGWLSITLRDQRAHSRPFHRCLQCALRGACVTRQEKNGARCRRVTSYYPFLFLHPAASDVSLARDRPLSLWPYHLSLSAPEMSPLHHSRIAHFFFFFWRLEKWSTARALSAPPQKQKAAYANQA